VQYRPTAAELLDAIAGLLEGQVMDAVPAGLQHQVRVAASLARILQREAELGPEAADLEERRLAELLDETGPLEDLRWELVQRLRRPDSDPAFERRAWDLLVATARHDLAIAKPGHDAWEGE
jgi:hypothetical protein